MIHGAPRPVKIEMTSYFEGRRLRGYSEKAAVKVPVEKGGEVPLFEFEGGD